MTDRATVEEAVEMLRKARIENAEIFDATVAAFMRLAYRTGRDDENEACAKLAEGSFDVALAGEYADGARREAKLIASRIRARRGIPLPVRESHVPADQKTGASDAPPRSDP